MQQVGGKYLPQCTLYANFRALSYVCGRAVLGANGRCFNAAHLTWKEGLVYLTHPCYTQALSLKMAFFSLVPICYKDFLRNKLKQQ